MTRHRETQDEDRITRREGNLLALGVKLVKRFETTGRYLVETKKGTLLVLNPDEWRAAKKLEDRGP